MTTYEIHAGRRGVYRRAVGIQWVRRSLVAAACLLSIGCAGLNTKTRSQLQYFSPLLSSEDIRQIQSLVAARRDIKQPVWEIATDEGRRDRARVSSGPWGKPGDESDYFYLEKRSGRWKIVSPIRRDRLRAENIVTTS